MLLRAMCSHRVLLTQFYLHCAFGTQNMEYYFHLSILIFLRAVFTHVASDTIWSSLCIWNPKSAKIFSFKNMHASQSNVSTHGASDTILSSVCFWNPQSGFFHLSIFMLLRAMCAHFMLLTHFETSNLEVFSFKHIHAHPGNVSTLHASDTILSSICIWNTQSGIFLVFKHVYAS